MHAADLLGAVEIGERAGDPQHAVITARRQVHGVCGVAQQRHAGGIGMRYLLQHWAGSLRIGVHVR